MTPFDPTAQVSVDEVLRLTYCLAHIFEIVKFSVWEQIHLDDTGWPVISAMYSLFGAGFDHINFGVPGARCDTDHLARGSIYHTRQEIAETARQAVDGIITLARRNIEQGRVKHILPALVFYWLTTRRYARGGRGLDFGQVRRMIRVYLRIGLARIKRAQPARRMK